MNPYRLIKNLEISKDTRVDLVESQTTGQRCVSKKVFKHADSLLIHQFHVEVDVLSQFNHPFVPVLIDVMDNRDSYVLIESYIEGESLDTWRKLHPLRFQWYKRKFILQLFDLLQELHGLGYLYIDVKPNNLIIRKNELYLVDFNACMEIGSMKAVMASKQNCAPEFNSDREKRESSDVWALGKLIQTMYPPGIIYWMMYPSRHKKVNKRFQSMRKMKSIYILAIRFQRILFLTFLILSLLFIRTTFPASEKTPLDVYLEDKDPMMFQNAYTYTLNTVPGSYTEKNQMALYEWISGDWLDDTDYQQVSISRFLLEQAIVSGNTSYCDYLLERIPNSVKEKIPDEISFALALCKEDYTVPYSRISEFIQKMTNDDLSFSQCFDRYMILITLLQNKGIVLDKDQRDLLYVLRDTWTVEDLSKDPEKTRNLAFLDSEYILFLKSRNISDVHIHNAFIELLGSDDEFSQLVEIERSAK